MDPIAHLLSARSPPPWRITIQLHDRMTQRLERIDLGRVFPFEVVFERSLRDGRLWPLVMQFPMLLFFKRKILKVANISVNLTRLVNVERLQMPCVTARDGSVLQIILVGVRLVFG